MEQKKDAERSIDDLVESQERLRQKSIPLDTKISRFTAFAWTCVIIGLIAAVPPLFYLTTLGYNGYGDFFGGTVAGLWSLGGIFFIYVAFLGQQQQLINQQIELIQSQIEMRGTRKELEGQKIEMEAQNKLFSVQRFETTFFHLLSNFNRIVDEIDFHQVRQIPKNNKSGSVGHDIRNGDKLDSIIVMNKGKDALKLIFQKFRDYYIKETEENEPELNRVYQAYDLLLDEYGGDLLHYLKNLVSMIKFVDNSAIENPNFYISLIEAQISPTEWSIIFYDIFTTNDEDWKKLSIKYELEKNVWPPLLLEVNHMNLE